MSKTELNVFFKLMQKDDKKEVLKFEIPGNDNERAGRDLFDMSGGIVVFEIDNCAAGEVTAEFKNIQRDDKKTTLKFFIKSDSEQKAQALYHFAGHNVKLSVQPSQMSIDEFYDGEDEHEGMEYNINNDGTVDIPEDQMSFGDAPEIPEDDEELLA